MNATNATTTLPPTPAEAWSVYVGSQSPAEFAARCRGSVADALIDYAYDGPFSGDLTGMQKNYLADALIAYARACGVQP